jgi:hypothetical protein
MNFAAIVRRPESAGFFSFLIGVGFAVMMFHRPTDTSYALALPPSEIEGKTIRADGACYLYRVEDASCDFVASK